MGPVEGGVESGPTEVVLRGEDSAEGCLSRQLRLRRAAPRPARSAGPGGDQRFQQAVYDKGTDTARSRPVTTAPVDAVLLFNGVFLLRPELIDRWDLRIFVSAAFEETLVRARTRDRALYGSATEVERRFRNRYRPSQQFYFDTARPTDQADIIVHNDEPSSRHGRPEHSDQVQDLTITPVYGVRSLP